MTDIDARFDDFRSFSSAMERLHINYAIRPADPCSFRGRIRRRDISGVIFAEMRVDACSGSRAATHSRADAEDYLCLTMYQRGRQLFLQDRRQIAVTGSDMMTWDAGSASRFQCSETTEVRTIMFPRRMVEMREGTAQDLIGRKADHGQALTRALFSHVNLIHDCIGEIASERRSQAIGSLIEMMSACLAPDASKSPESSHLRATLRRAERWIRDRIGEPISMTDLAQEFRVSPRALQHMFASAGTTFSAFVRQERLRQAALALRSTAFRGVSVTEIGLRFGFADAAHFSRSFKAAYGVSPLAYRTAAAS